MTSVPVRWPSEAVASAEYQRPWKAISHTTLTFAPSSGRPTRAFIAVLLVLSLVGTVRAAEHLDLRAPDRCRAAQDAQAGPHDYADRVIHEQTGIQLILVPAGTFTMGTNDPDASSNPQPARQVTITRPFYVGRTEVTNGQYRRFMKAMPDYQGEADVDPAYDLYLRHFRGKSVMSDADDHPVVYVSWQNANAFCDWASLAIPSEAQWEYACRAGATTKFSFGDDLADIPQYAWVDLAAGHETHPVATKLPNAWGLYDMHGNVWEWCADDYISGYEDAPADESVRRDPDAQTKPLRGGSWSTGPGRSLARTPAWFYSTALGSVSRLNVAPGNARQDRGFRVILPLSEVPPIAVSAVRPVPAHPSPAPSSPATAGELVAHYTFDQDTDGKVLDSSGRDNHGQNKGAQYVQQGEDQGFALRVASPDAVVDFGDRPDFDLRSHLTLEMWVHPESLPERREVGLLGKGFNSYLLSFTSRIWFYIGGGSNHCSADVALGEWQHVIATYDRQALRLYVDGRLIDQRAQAHPVAAGDHFFARPPLVADDQLERPWSYLLDDVRVYSRALSADEATKHFEAQAEGRQR